MYGNKHILIKKIIFISLLVTAFWKKIKIFSLIAWFQRKR